MLPTKELDKIVNGMLKEPEEPNFIQNGIQFGRGTRFKTETIDLTHQTTSVRVSNIKGNQLELLTKWNHFYSNQCYFIEWNCRTFDHLKGSTTENRIYFYWRGEFAPKGYSPLPMEVDVDTPVERINQWSEPAAFLSLFDGRFIVHCGNGPNSVENEARLYIFRGDTPNESHLFQIEASEGRKRSRAGFIALMKGGEVVLWHGSCSSESQRRNLRQIGGRLFGNDCKELFETESPSIGGLPLQNGDFLSMVKKSNLSSFTRRLFHVCVMPENGIYFVSRITSPHWMKDEVCAFPFLQSHLASADGSGAFFILDNYDEIYVWFEDESNLKIVQKIAEEYGKRRSSQLGFNGIIEVNIIQSKKEGPTFTNLFPVWDT